MIAIIYITFISPVMVLVASMFFYRLGRQHGAESFSRSQFNQNMTELTDAAMEKFASITLNKINKQ